MTKTTSLIALVFLTVLATVFPTSYAKSASEDSFLPTWKLLSLQEKQHFISGYIQGWLDAQKVTDIAIGFIRENPEKAIDSMESIKKLYDVSLLRPETLVRQIDQFYSKPENHTASLSMAITAVKAGAK